MKTSYQNSLNPAQQKTTFSGGKIKTYYQKPLSAVAARLPAHGAAELGQGGKKPHIFKINESPSFFEGVSYVVGIPKSLARDVRYSLLGIFPDKPFRHYVQKGFDLEVRKVPGLLHA